MRIPITGWQRLIGCLKLQVTFRERDTNDRALLRKMTCEDKASYGSSPPCTQDDTMNSESTCHELDESTCHELDESTRHELDESSKCPCTQDDTMNTEDVTTNNQHDITNTEHVTANTQVEDM